MKLAQLIQTLYYEPALITPDAHASIRQLLDDRLGDGRAGHQPSTLNHQLYKPATREPGRDFCGNEVEVEEMEIRDGIAYIPIGGALGQKLSPFDRGDGAVDILDVMQELDQAEDTSKCRGIILDMDSPGGMVSGTPELADRIALVEKPIYAFSRGMIASAAYWIASACDGIFTTRSAQVGSIGVYLPVLDVSGYYEQRGVKVELIKAGKFKGDGFPGTKLSDDGRAGLQERVNYIYSMFTAHVRSSRGAHIADETMQGQVFMGQEALRLGLVDALVTDISDVASLI
jgi:signal peptide peptidase SppA